MSGFSSAMRDPVYWGQDVGNEKNGFCTVEDDAGVLKRSEDSGNGFGERQSARGRGLRNRTTRAAKTGGGEREPGRGDSSLEVYL